MRIPLTLALAAILSRAVASADMVVPAPRLLAVRFGDSTGLYHHVRGTVRGRRGRDAQPRAPWRPFFLPPAVSIPDLYSIDVGERSPRPFAAPVELTGYGSLDVLPRRWSHRRSLSVGFARGSPSVFGKASSVVRIELEPGF